MKHIHTDVNGRRFVLRGAKPGPKLHGYVKILVALPPEHLAAMQAINAECGGLLPVNEQIRRSVADYLSRLVYTNPQTH